MNKFEPQYQFITPERYYQYINTLPPFTQLRYVAKTFLDGNKALIMPMPHNQKADYNLLVPYYLNKSHLIDGEVLGFDEDQEIQHVVNYGILKETTYRVLNYEILGDPIEVGNTLPNATGPHIKIVPIITDYYHRNEEEPYYVRSLKVGEPVWMHNSLNRLIFEDLTIIDDSVKEHPQREAYNRHMKWLKERAPKTAFRRMLDRMLA